MAKEIEIKFAVEDEEKMAEKLLSSGARKVFEGLEHNVVFDNGQLHKSGMLLRLRKTSDGKSVLTFKKGVRKAEFKEAEEIETGVSDFKEAKKILTGLGYKIFWIYEKQKSVFSLGNAEVSLDRLPFGTFIEIEGAKPEIRKAITKLGLDPKKGNTQSYLGLYKKYCKDKGIRMDNLVFWKKARPTL